MCTLRMILFWGAIMLSTPLLFNLNTYAAETCELVFMSCPEEHHGDTIDIPDNVTALSAHISACIWVNSRDPGDVVYVPPSIMFVIDHSGSMMYHYRQFPDYPMDPDGSRYTVTKDLIDTLYKYTPEAEIGFAIFAQHLYLDHRNHPYLQQFPYGGHTHGAYMPLVRLNDSTSYGDQMGYEMLKDLLETERVDTTHDDWTYQYVDLVYKPVFNINVSTNINCGFAAAKDAFQRTTTARENQFIIFLSDGEATHPQGSENDFVTATDVPTTFTIFFTGSGEPEAPTTIRQFTDNVRTNQYSETNSESDLWAFQTDHETLMNHLMEYVLDPYIIPRERIPYRMVINDQFVSTLREEYSFVFPDHFALQDSTTHFRIQIDYSRENALTGETMDTSTTTNIVFRRVEGAPVPEWFDIVCESNVKRIRLSKPTFSKDPLQHKFFDLTGRRTENSTGAGLYIMQKDGTIVPLRRLRRCSE